jgi:hypothetical protein
MSNGSDNCCICGYEFENKYFVIKQSFKICRACIHEASPQNDYEQVKTILGGHIKLAQQMDPELVSPEIKVEPADTLIQEAVNMLKKVNPNYFVGVRKIVLDAGQGFGHVSSGAGNDPAVIHINLPKIKAELQAKLMNATPEQKQKELVRQIAITISHEKGHVASFKPEGGFVGNEAPALQEEQSMAGKLDQYYNTLK